MLDLRWVPPRWLYLRRRSLSTYCCYRDCCCILTLRCSRQAKYTCGHVYLPSWSPAPSSRQNPTCRCSSNLCILNIPSSNFKKAVFVFNWIHIQWKQIEHVCTTHGMGLAWYKGIKTPHLYSQWILFYNHSNKTNVWEYKLIRQVMCCVLQVIFTTGCWICGRDKVFFSLVRNPKWPDVPGYPCLKPVLFSFALQRILRDLDYSQKLPQLTSSKYEEPENSWLQSLRTLRRPCSLYHMVDSAFVPVIKPICTE